MANHSGSKAIVENFDNTHGINLCDDYLYTFKHHRELHSEKFSMCFAVFPVIVARIIHQDPDLMIDVYVEDDDIVSVYQFEHYFMDCCRYDSMNSMFSKSHTVLRICVN